jgi:hypothetical protein
MRKFTEAEIEAGKSARGGFTRATLARWGVPWPPPKGWRKRITLRSVKSDAPSSPPASARSRQSVDLFGQQRSSPSSSSSRVIRGARFVETESCDRPPWETDEDGDFSVLTRDNGTHDVVDRGEVVASFPTNAAAWKWIDRGTAAAWKWIDRGTFEGRDDTDRANRIRGAFENR